MHVKSSNIEMMIGNKTDKIIEGLEESKRENNLVYNGVYLLYYKLDKISQNRGGLYIDFPKWLKNKKATINLKHDDQCFQYIPTAALNYQSIKTNPERISEIKHFIDQHDWKDINVLSNKMNWKNFESNKNQLLLICYTRFTILKK